jgi:endonuclease/exonuclease/phosphatase family metal-dependent hydrolase
LARIRNKHLRRAAYAVLVACSFCFLWFLANRAVSPWRAVRTLVMAPDAVPREPFEGRLRIATYNIAHSRGMASSNWQRGDMEAVRARLSRIADRLRDEDLDIVILNEVDLDAFWTCHLDQARFIAGRAGFPICIEQRNFDMSLPFLRMRWGNAVLSRLPMSEAWLVPLPSLSRCEALLAGRKQGLLCTVAPADAPPFRLLAVHLEHRSEAARVRGAAEIERLRGRSDMPLVLAGDMNSAPAGFPHAERTDDGRTALSVLLSGGAYRTMPEGEPTPQDLTFSTDDPHCAIDWIMVPTQWNIVAKDVRDWPLSDHQPVLMEVNTGR